MKPQPNLSPRLAGHVARATHLAFWSVPLLVAAQSTTTFGVVELPRVDITGQAAPPLTRVTDDIAASPANVTVLGRKELDAKTINTYGDIFRGLSGVYVNEYGQGLVAYEVKFRGFVSGHGSDVAEFLDGVPLNITGSQHINGYADLAQLIPELVDRVELVRGPFSVYAGNHAVAGSVQMYTDRRVPSSIKASVDNFGRVRVLPILSTETGPGTLLLAVDATKGSGYTRQSDVERLNVFARYAFNVAGGTAAFRLQAYNAIAEAPGFLDLARIRAGSIDRRDALTQGLGDAKHQQNAVVNYRSDDAEGLAGIGGGWSGSLYAVRDRRERYTNFDTSLPSGSSVPNGAERDRLRQEGIDLRKVTSFALGTMPSQFVAGLQVNREQVAALHFTVGPDRHQLPPSASLPDPVGIDRSVLTNTRSLYAQLQVQPVPVLKLTGGLRYDHVGFEVGLHPQDDTYSPAVDSGLGPTINTSAARVSPKLGAGLQVFDSRTSTVELYANYATGIKSPYAFSDFFSNVATSSKVPDLSLSTLRSVELGAQGAAKDSAFRWRAGVWDTRQQNEGQLDEAGQLQSFGTTTRRGFDLEGSVVVAAATRLYANYSALRARSLTAPAGQDRLTNVPERIGTLGIQSVLAIGSHRVEYSFEDSLVGPQPLTTDNALRGRSYNRLTARAAYTHPQFKGATAYLSLVGYDRPLEETQFDFGGGAVGVSPRPRLQATVGVQFPLNF